MKEKKLRKLIQKPLRFHHQDIHEELDTICDLLARIVINIVDIKPPFRKSRMKPLSHHVRKLAEYFERAEKLLDPKKARKLIEKAEKRKGKITERLRLGTKPQPAEPASEDEQ